MRIVELLHLCDSLFPIGAFGHSDGLESATASGQVASPDDLRDWLDVCLDETIGRTEGPAVRLAWLAIDGGDFERLVAIDGELHALRPAAAARTSSRAMGQRLLVTWRRLHADRRIDGVAALADARRIGPALPVAFAAASLGAGADVQSAIEAFAYTRLAATISAAMRLMAIGQTDAHALLARTLDRAPAIARDIVDRDAEIESFAPAMDIAQMNQQHVHSRLFRS
ncbi:MAG TPA: urease accessory UreF family protein [Vicinamibacterales bacterium]|nr:urease accessory UreF family protein [Vicinamibacterales bacterium]